MRHMTCAYECPTISNTLLIITASLRFRAHFALLQCRGAFYSRHSSPRAIVCPLLTTTPRRRKLKHSGEQASVAPHPYFYAPLSSVTPIGDCAVSDGFITGDTQTYNKYCSMLLAAHRTYPTEPNAL